MVRRFSKWNQKIEFNSAFILHIYKNVRIFKVFFFFFTIPHTNNFYNSEEIHRPASVILSHLIPSPSLSSNSFSFSHLILSPSLSSYWGSWWWCFWNEETRSRDRKKKATINHPRTEDRSIPCLFTWLQAHMIEFSTTLPPEIEPFPGKTTTTTTTTNNNNNPGEGKDNNNKNNIFY